MAEEAGMFVVQKTVGSVLCCKCGIPMAPNAANMCVKCLRSEVDITEGLQKDVIIIHCPECDTYLQPPRTWIKAHLESKELLTFCVRRVKNLNKVKLVDAGFIWTEPHSKRLKVKLRVQKEVLNGAVLEQACTVEYVVQDQMCESCSKVQANPDQWVASVQLRQHVSHRRTFFFLEQLILKHDAAARAIRITQVNQGIDFFFNNRSHGVKFVEFLGKVAPVKSRSDKQLVSHDTKSNNYNYKHTFSVELCPICREDLVCLPPKVSASLGHLGPLVICTKVSNNIALLDPFTLRHCFLDADQYWRSSFKSLLSSRQLVEYIVLDIESCSSEVTIGGSNYLLADAQVARLSDFGKNDTIFLVKTHLGHLLYGDRSWAKLQCGHHFHLDCIGSAFNVKGAMQCPNCRKIEKGQWLYSNGSRPYAEFNMEDYFHDEDIYDLSYAETSFGVHWCPFSGLTRLPSSFDEGELSSTAYHDLLGQHAVFAEQPAVSSASHPCPYVAYFGPFPSSSSNTSGSVGDGSNVSNHWNSQSAPSEIPTSYAFPSMDVHYHSWEQHSSLFPTASSHITGHDQPSLPSMTQRASRNNFDISRSGSFVHPFTAGHGSNARAASSVPASMLPPYLGSAARARERAQALQAYFQHPPGNSQGVRTPVMPATRRSNNSHRNLTQGGPVASSSEQASGFYFFPPSSSAGRNNSEVENPMSNRFHAWEREQQFPSYPVNQAERDPIWGPFHQLPSASDTGGLRPTIFRHRHGP